MNAFTQKALLNKLQNIKKRQKKNGFTLIELMVVVAILGVLMAVGLPELSKAQEKAKASAAESWVTKEAKNCSLALVINESYTLDTAGAPDDVTPLTTGDGASTCAKKTADTDPQIVADGGGKRYTVLIDEQGVPSTAEETTAPS